MSKPLITRICMRQRHPSIQTRSINTLPDSLLEPNPSRLSPSYIYTGTISRTLTMPSTVQITREVSVYDKFLKKHYTRPLRLKAHDPNAPGFLREGDVVEYSLKTQHEKDEKREKNEKRIRETEEKLRLSDETGKQLRTFQRVEAKKKEMKTGQGVKFVVRRVVTPFGEGLEDRQVLKEEVGEEVVERRKKGRGRYVERA